MHQSEDNSITSECKRERDALQPYAVQKVQGDDKKKIYRASLWKMVTNFIVQLFISLLCRVQVHSTAQVSWVVQSRAFASNVAKCTYVCVMRCAIRQTNKIFKDKNFLLLGVIFFIMFQFFNFNVWIDLKIILEKCVQLSCEINIIRANFKKKRACARETNKKI